MPDAVDLGGAPADKDCAQLGQTEDFARLNRLGVATYRAAMIARFGQPPEGAFVTLANRHDFGIYRTLGLTIDAGPARSNTAVLAYSQAVQDGLSSWVEAGFAPPVRYEMVASRPSSGAASLISSWGRFSRPARMRRAAIPSPTSNAIKILSPPIRAAPRPRTPFCRRSAHD